jgi:response regulator RpfG family c-di-GMP phosphodiesterase
MIKILIIDEDTDILRQLWVKLTSAVYEVFQARDGKEALTVAEKETPEVVVMEQVLPDVDGFALLSGMSGLSWGAYLWRSLVSACLQQCQIYWRYLCPPDLCAGSAQ